ncbi:MAG: nucleotidyltransferase family protein [Candidatus Omnitrophota bacterium]|jgi:glucose-1-phosphate thymidylyltransferase
MKALILAAGYATRLYPLTKEYPKPLLEIKERPIIEHIIRKLQGLKGLEEIVVVTNSKFFSKFKQWRKNFKCPKKITLLDDLTKNLDDRRGAVGDMDFAIRVKKIKDGLLIIGGDNLLDSKLEPFLSFAQKNAPHPTIGVYDIKKKSEAKNYGVVKLGVNAQVIDFKEKPAKPVSQLVAMCVYYFPAESITLVKKYMRAHAKKVDASGFYIDWLRKETAVYGYVFKGSWFDIGDKKFYHKAQKTFN